MLTGFEQITCDITPEEREFATWLSKKLSLHIGKEMAITNSKMRQKLLTMGKEVSDSQIRKYIHYIRENNLVRGLIATSAGYYVANSSEEILAYIESLEQRESSIRAIRLEMQKYYKHISITKPTLVPVETIVNQ